MHPVLARRSRTWRQATDTVATGAVRLALPQTDCGGLLLAGDAAGFIDPFVGDGIAISLRSGCMAGEIAARIASGEVTQAAGISEYRQRYHEAFDGAFRNAGRLRKLLDAPAAARSVAMVLLKLPLAAEWMVRATRSA